MFFENSYSSARQYSFDVCVMQMAPRRHPVRAKKQFSQKTTSSDIMLSNISSHLLRPPIYIYIHQAIHILPSSPLPSPLACPPQAPRTAPGPTAAAVAREATCWQLSIVNRICNISWPFRLSHNMEDMCNASILPWLRGAIKSKEN